MGAACSPLHSGDGPTMRDAPELESTFAAQLRKTLDAIPAYTWYASPSGALTFVNGRTADYLGLPKDHPLRLGMDTGAAWDSHIPLLHPDDHEESRRVWSNCLRTGLADEVSFRIRNAQGGYRWFGGRAEPLRASDGTVLCWMGVNVDIEEHKQNEFYLVQGQRLARTGSWAFDSSGFEYWSSQLFEIHGLDPAGKPPGIPEYTALVHPDDRDFVAQAIRKMLAEQLGFDFTKRIIRPDGTMRHVRCVGVPRPNGHGFVGTGMDVTEQEQWARRLVNCRDELQQILDFTPLLIAVFGPRRERLYVNRIALDYIGVTLEEWLAGGPGAQLHPDDSVLLQSRWNHALATGTPFEIEVRICKAQGGYGWFLARLSPVLDDKGRVMRWYCACTDIEARKQAEERLQQENAALQARIAERTRIARDLHDTLLGSFNALLIHLEAASILFQSQPAAAKRSLDNTIAQAARVINEGREAVEGLRSSAIQSIDLAATIERLPEEISSLSGASRPIAFRVEVDGIPRHLHPTVTSEVYGIAREALRNAFQHSRGTRIDVELSYHALHFRLRIRDDGQGLDAETLASRGREGHFGLKGMHERAELVGGKLTLLSARGAGAEWELTIPGAHAYPDT